MITSIEALNYQCLRYVKRDLEPFQILIGPNASGKSTFDAFATIRIYNINGRLIRTIALGQKAAGMYLSKDRAAYWNGRDDFGEKVSSGVYFYTLQAGKFVATRKLVLVK